MKRIYAVIILRDDSTFEPNNGDHLDEMAEDLLSITNGVAEVAVFERLDELQAEIASGDLEPDPEK